MVYRSCNSAEGEISKQIVDVTGKSASSGQGLIKKSWNGGMRSHKALILGKPSYFTGFQIAYKHTRQTKCKPALLNMHQKSFHTTWSHNRDIMLGHRKS